MSQHKSATSLQNSVYSWSFSKSSRFRDNKASEKGSLYTLPDFKNRRAPSLGFGTKYDLRPLQGRDSPPPNTYRIKTVFDINMIKKKGPIILEKLSGAVK
jgi:hypothetical protein